MITAQDINGLVQNGGSVCAPDGEKIGPVGRFFLSDRGEQPAWVSIDSGLLAARQPLVPLDGARIDGLAILVSYTKDQVRDAPLVDPKEPLGPETVRALRRHYALTDV